MIIVGGAALGAIIELHCPACGETQARARGPVDTTYACRNCGEPIVVPHASPPPPEPKKKKSR